MFAGWNTFYQMTGEAAATLTGLLFIVATLSAAQPSSGVSQGMRLFTTPTVYHLVSVMVVSALALAPPSGGRRPCVLMIVWTSAGLIYVASVAVRLSRLRDPTHWSDVWCYGAAPLAIYAGLTFASAAAWIGAPHAADGLGLCLLAVLALTIRNAWDLVTWLAPRRGPDQSQG
jgi:hypothetical protein